VTDYVRAAMDKASNIIQVPRSSQVHPPKITKKKNTYHFSCLQLPFPTLTPQAMLLEE
jgi:hypothetical protein